MKVKLFLVSLFVCAVAGALYFGVASRGRSAYPDKAYHSFAKGNMREASCALEQLSSDRLALPIALYQGYIAQGEGAFAESELFLRPLLATRRGNRSELLAQVHCGLINAAYQQGKDEEIASHIEAVKALFPGHPSLLFFDGLSNYLQQQYSEAYRLWIAYHPSHIGKEASWLIALIDQYYPPSWRHVHLGHCLLEKGDLEGGRQLLEQQQHQLRDTKQHSYQLATLFLGLTYLQEAQNFPVAKRASYYQLAHFYFKHAAGIEGFEREHRRVIHHLEKELLLLTSETLFAEDHIWTFPFIRLLQDWQADLPLETLATQFVERMVDEEDQVRIPFCHVLKNELNNTLFHRLLCQKLMDHMKDLVLHHHEATLPLAWSLMTTLSPSIESAKKELSSVVYDHLMKTLFWDDETFSRSGRLITFYRQLNGDAESDRTLANNLLKQSVQLWHQIGKEERGALLMELALDISPNRAEIEGIIGSFLKELYLSAEENNLLVRLTLIHDTLASFGITMNKTLFDDAKIANHLADADYLYEARNYAAAQTHAAWVLKLAPQNRLAQRLVGLCAYHLGDYKLALQILQQLPHHDLSVQKAIAFSAVHARAATEEHICQIDNRDSFKEDE